MDTSCELGGWSDSGQPKRVEVVAPDHPIARGIRSFTIPKDALFLEPFPVPSPEDVVLRSTFAGGETFRSGLTWTVDLGRVAYLRPGHEAFPVLFHPSLRRVIANAARWTAPAGNAQKKAQIGRFVTSGKKRGSTRIARN